MRFLLLTALLAAFACTKAKPAELPPPPSDMLLAHVQEPNHKLTYAEAHAQALATGKPLVVWQGSAVCLGCAHNTADEFVHCVTSNLEGTNPNSVTIYVPENGTLQTAGEVTWWITSDKTYGHIPSVRRVLANWRANRTLHRQMAPAAYGGGMALGYRAMAVMTAPVRMMTRGRMMGGACASCR